MKYYKKTPLGKKNSNLKRCKKGISVRVPSLLKEHPWRTILHKITKVFERCIRSNVLHRAQSFQKRKWTCIPGSRYSDSTQVLYDYGPKYFRSCLLISMSQLNTKLTLLAIHICITLGYSIHWCHNHRTIHPNHEMQFPFLDNIPNIYKKQ